MEFIKNGACPTYIKQNGKVQIIKALSLPAGIIENISLVVYDKDIDENIKVEYNSYIQEFRKEDYVLSFLELQNEELYIDDTKIENGQINTHYILMAYFEEGKLEFLGYNIDNGIKIKFEKQEGKFKEYLEKI